MRTRQSRRLALVAFAAGGSAQAQIRARSPIWSWNVAASSLEAVARASRSRTPA